MGLALQRRKFGRGVTRVACEWADVPMSVVVRMQQCYRTVDSGQVVHIMLFSLLVYVFACIFTCIVFCSPLFYRVHQVVTRLRSVNRYYSHIWFDLKLRGLRSEIGREEIVWLDIDQSSAAQRPRERERERARCSGCGGQSESIGQFHGDSSPTTEQPVTAADRDWIFAPFPGHLRLYDTIRDAILTCARKPTRVRLIYHTEPTTKKCKNRKTKKIENRYAKK